MRRGIAAAGGAAFVSVEILTGCGSDEQQGNEEAVPTTFVEWVSGGEVLCPGDSSPEAVEGEALPEGGLHGMHANSSGITDHLLVPEGETVSVDDYGIGAIHVTIGPGGTLEVALLPHPNDSMPEDRGVKVRNGPDGGGVTVGLGDDSLTLRNRGDNAAEAGFYTFDSSSDAAC